MRQRKAGATDVRTAAASSSGHGRPAAAGQKERGTGRRGNCNARSSQTKLRRQLTAGVLGERALSMHSITHRHSSKQGMHQVPPDFSDLQLHTRMHHRAREMTSFITSLVPP